MFNPRYISGAFAAIGLTLFANIAQAGQVELDANDLLNGAVAGTKAAQNYVTKGNKGIGGIGIEAYVNKLRAEKGDSYYYGVLWGINCTQKALAPRIEAMGIKGSVPEHLMKAYDAAVASSAQACATDARAQASMGWPALKGQ